MEYETIEICQECLNNSFVQSEVILIGFLTFIIGMICSYVIFKIIRKEILKKSKEMM